MDSNKADYFVKEFQKWTATTPDESMLQTLSEKIDEANNNWASLVEDWVLLDEQQKRAEKGNAYRAQLHYHKLVAELYGYSFALIDNENQAKPSMIPAIREDQSNLGAASNEHGMQIPINIAVQPTFKMVGEIIEPFLNKSSMVEATYQKLRKLKGILEGAAKSMNDFALDKLTFEPVVAYFATRLLDEPTKIVIRMLKGDAHYSLQDLIEVIEKRMSIMADPQDIEMREPDPPANAQIPVTTNPDGESNLGANSASSSTVHDDQGNRSRPFCQYCRAPHWLQACESFKQLHWSQRAISVLSLPICANCFRDNHVVDHCPGGPCRTCKIKHNSLLCPENPMNK